MDVVFRFQRGVIIKSSDFRNTKLTLKNVFLQFIVKIYRGINGRTSGSGHGLQVLRTSWTRSDEDQQPAGSCRTGSGCPWSLSWKPHPRLSQSTNIWGYSTGSFVLLRPSVWQKLHTVQAVDTLVLVVWKTFSRKVEIYPLSRTPEH